MKITTKLLMAGLILGNILYNMQLPIHPDEAYYWVWSRNLALSYFDHPPLIAYSIKLFAWMGSQEAMIRMPSVLFLSGAAWCNYKVAEGLFNSQVGERAMWIFLCMPLTQIGFHLATPDAPYAFFWSLTVYLLYRGIFCQENRMLYAAGISAGLMLLAKYPGVLLFPSIFIFLLLSPRYRYFLGKKELYMATILAFIVFIPVIFWNSQHDWASFRFQFSHGIAEEKVVKWDTFGEFIGGQAGVMNPVFFIGFLWYMFRYGKKMLCTDRLAFLFWPCAFTLFFFGQAALFKKSELNWAATAYFTGSILVAYWVTERKNRWMLPSGIAISVILLSLTLFPQWFPWLPGNLALQGQIMGYRQVMEQAGRELEPGDTGVISDSFQNAALAEYYLPNHPKVRIVTPVRVSQYDYWLQDMTGEEGRQMLYIGEEGQKDQLEKVFQKVEPLPVIRYEDSYVKRTYEVYRCYGYHKGQ